MCGLYPEPSLCEFISTAKRNSASRAESVPERVNTEGLKAEPLSPVGRTSGDEAFLFVLLTSFHRE